MNPTGTQGPHAATQGPHTATQGPQTGTQGPQTATQGPQTATTGAESAHRGDERSIATLLKEIRDETTTLFRQEVALARTEISEKVSRLVRNVVTLAAGGMLAFAGLIVLLMAAGAGATIGLQALGMGVNSLWLGPLIVGAVVVLIGFGLFAKGKNALQDKPLTPERTIESMKENKEWAKSKAR